MKLLLDENLPVKLKYRFKDAGLDVFTIKNMNWFGKENGELLSLLLSNSFTGLITIEQPAISTELYSLSYTGCGDSGNG